MAYIVYGRLKCTGLNMNLELNKKYKIKISEDENFGGSFTIPLTTPDYPLELLKKYFKIYLNKNELLELIKNNLSITDDNIIEYEEYYHIKTICVKYKHDLIYLKLRDHSESGFHTTVDVEITSNNLARQKTFEIELFEDHINKFCDLLKLMHK